MTDGEPRYPPLPPQLPAHLVARLHATARVLGSSPEQIVADALDGLVVTLSADQRELIDRIAASLVRAHEL